MLLQPAAKGAPGQAHKPGGLTLVAAGLVEGVARAGARRHELLVQRPTAVAATDGGKARPRRLGAALAPAATALAAPTPTGPALPRDGLIRGPRAAGRPG